MKQAEVINHTQQLIRLWWSVWKRHKKLMSESAKIFGWAERWSRDHEAIFMFIRCAPSITSTMSCLSVFERCFALVPGHEEFSKLKKSDKEILWSGWESALLDLTMSANARRAANHIRHRWPKLTRDLLARMKAVNIHDYAMNITELKGSVEKIRRLRNSQSIASMNYEPFEAPMVLAESVELTDGTQPEPYDIPLLVNGKIIGAINALVVILNQSMPYVSGVDERQARLAGNMFVVGQVHEGCVKKLREKGQEIYGHSERIRATA